MGVESLGKFLSGENIQMHYDYLNNLRLKFSIIRKSYPKFFSGDNDCRILGGVKGVPEIVIYEARRLFDSIKSHEIFFDSFSEQKSPCTMIRKQFSSEEGLKYEVYDQIKDREYGYAYVNVNEKGKIYINISDDGLIKYRGVPIVAIDLYEHVYFLDYGFDKKHFLRNALSHLKLSSLDKEKK